MNIITMNISVKQQKVLIVIALVLYGFFLWVSGYELGYSDGFDDAVAVCSAIGGC